MPGGEEYVAPEVLHFVVDPTGSHVPDPGFQWLWTLSRCDVCSAFVDDLEVHTAWHQRRG